MRGERSVLALVRRAWQQCRTLLEQTHTMQAQAEGFKLHKACQDSRPLCLTAWSFSYH